MDELKQQKLILLMRKQVGQLLEFDVLQGLLHLLTRRRDVGLLRGKLIQLLQEF